ncbi:caspase family protein [Myxosarcina sp. GI1]|uniref:nSTAND1 domain-containing NTPase n=1 Tax=Myxosarcina sp. GI1 TaxID=1541065 RepID=UPI00055E7449|nr:caspase family protein [Myxosarcina sp. GI1]
MCPRAKIRTPKAIHQSKAAKLWILLVGVNHYQDGANLPSLRYSALDCQGLGKALESATVGFAAKEIIVHHDYATRQPSRASVFNSLKHIVTSAHHDDTILFYFSGHGILEPTTQQIVLCLADTQKDRLLETGLVLKQLLKQLESAASQQLVWLDACHSGGMSLRGTTALNDPSDRLVKLLRRKASQSQGFYALLSCDRAQQSWEFPELGHGVFTYYLMRGLQGEAADTQGIIEADALYQYVYHQTLRYIDKTNQQIRLINQQKSSRGESKLQSEFPLQTPKRIVEGFGKVVLGKRSPVAVNTNSRQAVVIDGGRDNSITLALSKVLRGKGGFSLNYFPQAEWKWSAVSRAIIASFDANPKAASKVTTALLYLKGKVVTSEGEAKLILKNGVSLSRSWLRQALKNSRAVHQIVILDCPEANTINEWIEELQLERGQCLIAANALSQDSEQFTRILLETLENADSQSGFSVAALIAQLQVALADTKIIPQIWLSGTQGVIEVLPAKSSVNEDSGIYDLNLCPYRGLKAFDEDNAQYFYGREELVQWLLDHTNHNSVIAVVGASGSGKSSVVQAGLIAQLRQGKHIPQSDRWWLGCFRPGSKPIEALAKSLTDSGNKQQKAQQQLQIEGLLYQGVEGFVCWLRSRPEPVVLLAIDQFEELFTLADIRDRQQFLELILGAVKYAGDRFKLVFTIRADFVASCLEIPELATLVQQHTILVPPYLTKEDYRSAIAKPAEQVGLKVEPGLIEILLQDLDRSAGDLPLLQFVLQQLWQRRQGGKLTFAAYQQLGGIKGALERQAEAVYQSLDPQAKECARWIFLSLTKLGDGTEDTRRRVTKSELVVQKYPADLVEQTLQKLTAANLLVVNLDRGIAGQGRSAVTPPAEDELFLETMRQEATVEVVHEILIHHWSTLRWWIEENRTRLRSQRQIERAANLWQQQNKQPDFLLQGVRLAEAEEIYVKYTDELSPIAQEFVATCLDAQLAAQTAAKRRLRKARITAAALGILGLAATAFGVAAYRQKLIAQVNNIGTLNTSSEALLVSDRQLESLVTSVKAGKQIEQIGSFGRQLIGNDNWQNTKLKTAATLQQSVYGTQELNRLTGHAQQVNAVAYSPDGELLATASDDNTIKLWDNNGQLITTLKRHQDAVIDIVFNPKRQRPYLLATASADNTIILWEITGNNVTQISQLVGHQDWITKLAFSSDGNLLASASRDGTIKLWNKAGLEVDTLSGHEGWVNSVSFSSDNKLLISGDEAGNIKLWQRNRNGIKEIKTISEQQRVTNVGFIDNKHFATAGDDGIVKLWQLSNDNLVNSYSNSGQVNSFSFSPDGKYLASATREGIYIWNRDGLLLQTLNGHTGEVLDVSFKKPISNSSGDYQLVSTGVDKTVRIWQINGNNSSDNGGIYSIATSPTEPDVFAAAGWDGKIKIWQEDSSGTPQLVRTLPGHDAAISQIQYTPDGKLIASGSQDNTIKLWNAKTGDLITTLTGHREAINNLALVAENKWQAGSYLLVSGSEDNTLKLWKIDNQRGELITTMQGHQDSVKSVAVSPNGKLIASGSYDNTIKLWNTDGELIDTLSGHNLVITSLQFSPDSRTLASGSWDNTVKLWQINSSGKNFKLSHTLTAHQDGVTSLDFNSEGTILASASGDRTIKLWDVNSGKLIKNLQGHSSQINSVAFTNDDITIISAEEQQGLFWWNLELDSLLTKGCDRLSDYLQNNADLSQQDRQICD